MSAPHLPGVFATLAPLLDHYGYWAVGGTLFIENVGSPISLGQTIFIAGAIYAGAGRLNIIILSVIGIVMSVAGAAIGYAIGRSGGRPLVHRYGRYVFMTRERFARTEAYFIRRGAFLILIARFLEGMKQANGLLAGITEMRFLRFLLYNSIGAVLWIGVHASVGYLAGNHIVPIYDRITRYSLYLLIALIAVAALLVVRHVVRRRPASPASAAELAATADRADPGESSSAEPGTARD
jgi:membrane protein DedA with SNARE-associated domain